MKIPLHTNTAVVFRLSAMGDVALMSGVLSYWNSLYRTKFIVITREEFAPLFENHPAIAGIEALSKESLEYKTYSQTCKKLAEKYADFPLFDLHASTRSRLLAHQWKTSVYRYNKMPVLRRLFLWSKGKIGKTALLEKDVRQRYASLLCEDPVAPRLLKPKIYLDEDERTDARNLLAELFPNNTKKIVAIHPFATHKAKTLPLGHWQKISAVLSGEYQILFVGKGDLPENMYGKNLINKTNLRELCAVLSQCSLLITGDSGPMHLADAVDTPLLALFGPTTKEWGFFPVGENAHILQKEMPCRPCSLHGKQKCRQKESCLEKISTEEIIAHAKKILS